MASVPHVNTLKCLKCERTFTSNQKLEKHKTRKIPCDRVIKCDVCNKLFKLLSDLKRHKARKTPCAIIHGNPTVAVGDDTCIYCRKVFKTKYNAKDHLRICKVKNGGMEHLVAEVRRLSDKLDKSNNGIPGSNNINGNNNNNKTINKTINNINNIDQSNHFNTNLNINLINFGDGTDVIKQILKDHAFEILSKKIQLDLPLVDQISDRVINLIGLVFRNPEYKELQGVYVLDLEKDKDNAFHHEDGNWMLTNWSTLRIEILQKLYNCLERTKEDRKRDIMNIINYIFVLGNCGNCHTIKNLDDNETLQIYNDMGKHLQFGSICKAIE